MLLQGQKWLTTPCRLAHLLSWALTLLELYPHTGVILDLLDHLSAPADDHTNRMPGHWHLRKEGGRGQLGSTLAALLPSAAQWPGEEPSPRQGPPSMGWRPVLTSMPPPIRDPYSFRSPKPPWSRSRRMSITISQACCKHTGYGARGESGCPRPPASPVLRGHGAEDRHTWAEHFICHPERQARPAPTFSR